MKRPFEGRGGDEPRKKGRDAGTLPCVLKFLTPEVLAAAVIGKGGSVISRIRESCQAVMGLSDKGDFYPGTDCRILTASTPTADLLVDVSRQVIDKLVECAEGSDAYAESVGEPNQLKLKVVVPKVAAGGIIGKGGQNIKQLREQGAKVHIDDAAVNSPSADQMVTIIGTANAMEYVMAAINREVQAVNTEPWFPAWSSTPVNSRGSGDDYRSEMSSQRSSWNGHGSSHGHGYSEQPSYGGGGGGGGPPRRQSSHGSSNTSLADLISVAQSLPEYVMEDSRGFALSCVVPEKLVGGLIGRGGSGTKDISARTNTEIKIRELPGDAENRQLNITGPLASTCAAYMLMMKRYLDAEGGAGPPAVEDRPPLRSSGRYR